MENIKTGKFNYETINHKENDCYVINFKNDYINDQIN